jgi:hypothetical protein
VNIGGWFLSDSPGNVRKYEIHPNTWIDPLGYILLYQDIHFDNPQDPGSHSGFGFASGGETICLYSALGGILTGYSEVYEFGAAPTLVSFGRYQNSLGRVNLVLTQANTPGAANSDPHVGPIVISEIMYNPGTEDQSGEYVELLNISGSPVTLYDFDMSRPWRMWAGDIFLFPSDPPLTLPPQGRLLIAKAPETLMSTYESIPSEVTILGPYSRDLPDIQGVIWLQMSEPTSRAYPVLDQVEYNTPKDNNNCRLNWQEIWPPEADGRGASLTRIDPHRYGNEPTNWQATPPTPGY